MRLTMRNIKQNDERNCFLAQMELGSLIVSSLKLQIMYQLLEQRITINLWQGEEGSKEMLP